MRLGEGDLVLLHLGVGDHGKAHDHLVALADKIENWQEDEHFEHRIKSCKPQKSPALAEEGNHHQSSPQNSDDIGISLANWVERAGNLHCRDKYQSRSPDRRPRVFRPCRSAQNA